MWILRTIMLLALIVWIGGIIFFAFVLAPTLFAVLPNTQMAGNVVGPSLSKLHSIGLIAGAVFLLCSLVYNWRKYSQLRLFSATHILVVLMLLLTAISQFGITPRMHANRASWEMVRRPGYDPYIPGTVEQLKDYYDRKFQRLHSWSERLEGTVLLLGLGVVVSIARRVEKGT